jgi:hypothetical protein
VLALIVLPGCSFEIPPPSYINGTEVLMVRHSVEIGPLDPERVGPSFASMEDAPIAEILPGDRLRLEPVVVDHEGRRLAQDELETLWVQCGRSCEQSQEIFPYWPFDPRCDELDDYHASSSCVLGTGDGAFELEVPPLHSWSLSGLLLGDLPRLGLFGVVAWDGRAAEDCWASRRGDQSQLEGCGFIYHDVLIGPLLWAVANAESLGAESPIDEELPPLVEYQPANRIPLTPALTVRVDDEIVATGVPPLPTITIEPGAHISIELAYEPFSQSLQRILKPLAKYSAWELVDEQLWANTASSGAIWRVGAEEPVSGDGSFSYEVDPESAPGRSRVLILYSDDRLAADSLSVEFEVR